jgi:hypothetical protein
VSLTPGSRYQSQVCTTEVIVIKGSDVQAALECGGEPMIALQAAPASRVPIHEGWNGGSALGKRFTNSARSLEILVTKAGTGTLGVGGERLVEKGSKPLPSSD